MTFSDTIGILELTRAYCPEEGEAVMGPEGELGGGRLAKRTPKGYGCHLEKTSECLLT